MQIGSIYLSPKSLTAIIDAVVSILLLIAARVFAPGDFQLVKEIVLYAQVIVGIIIAAQFGIELYEAKVNKEFMLYYPNIETDDDEADAPDETEEGGA